MADVLREHPKRAYSIREVCSLTGLGRSSVYMALNTGKLSALKSGRRTVIPAEAVDAWMASLPRASFNKSVTGA